MAGLAACAACRRTLWRWCCSRCRLLVLLCAWLQGCVFASALCMPLLRVWQQCTAGALCCASLSFQGSSYNGWLTGKLAVCCPWTRPTCLPAPRSHKHSAHIHAHQHTHTHSHFPFFAPVGACVQLRKVPDSSPHYTKARMAMADIYLKHRKDKAAYIRCYMDLVVREAPAWVHVYAHLSVRKAHDGCSRRGCTSACHVPRSQSGHPSVPNTHMRVRAHVHPCLPRRSC